MENEINDKKILNENTYLCNGCSQKKYIYIKKTPGQTQYHLVLSKNSNMKINMISFQVK